MKPRPPQRHFIRTVSAIAAASLLPFALSLPRPFALRPSPFALRPSPFALRPSPFALRPSPFALRSSLRVYRYDAGDKFGIHRDQSYEGDTAGERSMLTLLVYLNDGFDGGETVLHEPESLIITPKAGQALWFQHMLLHEGRPVLRGVKDVLRSDVVYGAAT
ncbi:MAG: 2OG-Fe(II) oxygenase [Deltaproteobacteria bacterium]|nr:2OG-Fe(II) oxygenase [Deltaproteobacteria bacterium]